MKRFYNYKTTLLFISLAMSLSILFGFSMVRNISIETPIRIVDFTSMTQDQLLSWSQENDIKIVTEEVYDDLITIGNVISQNVIVGERLFAGSTIKVTVSKGPDPEVMVNLIDFTGKDIGEIQQFIENNKLLASTIEFEKSTEVSSAYFIRIDTTSTSVKRGQALKFFISTGSKDELTTVLVPDFKEYTRTQISTWGTTNNIKTNFVDEFNNDLASGKVISQSQAANSQIYDGSSITVKLSLGTGVVLENMVGKSKTTIDKFINDNGLKVSYSYTYSSSQNKDLGISMTPSASTRVGNGSTVNITLSLGKISVSDFKGKTLAQLQAWVTEVNKQGANLKVTSSQEYSEGTNSGLIITQTPSSGDINPATTIKASVSKGAGVVVGTFIGTTKTSQEGLRVTTSSTYSGSVPSGQVISQSLSAGSTVDNNSSISLVISKGQVQVGTYSSLSALESWKNSVNSEGGNISISTSEDWNAATKGSLVSHSNANSSVNPGTTITAFVSKGPSATVPNYVGSGEPSSGSGITISVISRDFSSTYASGLVISQDKNPGVYASGVVVGIRVSKGPMPSIPVYDFSNLNSYPSDQIGAQISSKCAGMSDEAGGTITCNVDRNTFREGATGKVYSQSPAPGSPISAGGTITIYIGK